MIIIIKFVKVISLTIIFYLLKLCIFLECDYQCKECSIRSNICEKCSDITRILVNNSCLCNKGYYDTGTEKCSKCDHTCEECKHTAKNCQVCSDINRDLENSCLCKTGWFDYGKKIC